MNETKEVAKPQTAAEKKVAKRMEAIMKTLTNKVRREAVEHFDKAFDDFDGIEMTIVIAHLADRTKSFEDLEDVTMGELESIITGE